jgi:uncharacterized protein (TIGR03437 family)
MVPEGTVAGPVQVAVTSGSVTQTISATISTVVPRLFSLDGTGTGLAAATAIATQVNDPQLQFPVPVFQCSSSGCVAVPINLGVDTPTYLTLYGTGIRNRSSLAKVAVTVGGISVPVLYAGPTPDFSGLDQVNVGLLLSLRGSGQTNVVVTVDGQVSNAVMVDIQ